MKTRNILPTTTGQNLVLGLSRIIKAGLFLISICLIVSCTGESNESTTDTTEMDELPVQLTSAESIRSEKSATDQQMFLIERNIPGAGNFSPEDLKSISQTSCGVLDEMSGIKWLHSYVTGDKIYCVYTAQSEELIREHAEKGGFPADAVVKVGTIIDPSTAE